MSKRKNLVDETAGGLHLEAHAAGHLRVFGGQAWKVFEKYDLFYDLTFDAAPVADFKSRR